MEPERQRRWWIAAVVAALALAAGGVVVATQRDDERIATSDATTSTTTTTTVVLPSDTDTVGERTALSEPGEVRTYVARLQSKAEAAPDDAALDAALDAAERLLDRRIDLLVDCSSCVERQSDGSLRLQVSGADESPSLDLVQPVLTSLYEVTAAPVLSSDGRAPCASPLLTDLDGTCVTIGGLTTLAVADVELGGPRADGQRTVSVRLGESAISARAMLAAACRAAEPTCPTGRLLLVRGERVLADLTSDAGDGDPTIALGRHPAAEAHLLAAELVTDPALDRWTISLERIS